MKKMQLFKRVMDGLLIVQSLVLIFRGGLAALITGGAVVGSDFGMQATIAHLLSGFVVWCGIFGLWYFLFQAIPGHRHVWNDADKAQDDSAKA